MTEENKKKVVEGITRVLMELGILHDAVTVISMKLQRPTGQPGDSCIRRSTQIVRRDEKT